MSSLLMHLNISNHSIQAKYSDICSIIKCKDVNYLSLIVLYAQLQTFPTCQVITSSFNATFHPSHATSGIQPTAIWMLHYVSSTTVCKQVPNSHLMCYFCLAGILAGILGILSCNHFRYNHAVKNLCLN